MEKYSNQELKELQSDTNIINKMKASKQDTFKEFQMKRKEKFGRMGVSRGNRLLARFKQRDNFTKDPKATKIDDVGYGSVGKNSPGL